MAIEITPEMRRALEIRSKKEKELAKEIIRLQKYIATLTTDARRDRLPNPLMPRELVR